MLFSHSRLRIKIIITLLFLTTFYALPLHAEPEQRLIIHFKHKLTETHHHDIDRLLHSLIRTEFTLAEHSNSLRWIVILQERLEPQKLSHIKNELLKNLHIKQVELDVILNKATLIQAQLLPL